MIHKIAHFVEPILSISFFAESKNLVLFGEFAFIVATITFELLK